MSWVSSTGKDEDYWIDYGYVKIGELCADCHKGTVVCLCTRCGKLFCPECGSMQNEKKHTGCCQSCVGKEEKNYTWKSSEPRSSFDFLKNIDLE